MLKIYILYIYLYSFPWNFICIYTSIHILVATNIYCIYWAITQKVRYAGWRNIQIRCYCSVFLHDFNNIKMRIRWTIFLEENLNLIDGVLPLFWYPILKEKREPNFSGYRDKALGVRLFPNFVFSLRSLCSVTCYF